MLKFQLKIEKHDSLTKSYTDSETDKKEFFKSLITNAFATNKDFVNDIVTIDSDNFYFFNVTDIEPSIPLDLVEIKETVLQDWQKTKKIEIIEKKLKENMNNTNYVEELSSFYDQPIKKLEIDKNSQELPVNLITKIFEAEKGSNSQKLKDNNIYIANVTDILIPTNVDKDKNLSLMGNLRNSFSNELFNNVKISTNDSLINAVIDRY